MVVASECFVLQLGSSSGPHHHSRVSGQDWLRRFGGVGGLVLGQDSRLWPSPVDASDWEDLGVLGLRHPSCPLRPDQETHPHSGEDRATLQPLLHGLKWLHHNINAVLSHLHPSICWSSSYQPFSRTHHPIFIVFIHVFLFCCSTLPCLSIAPSWPTGLSPPLSPWLTWSSHSFPSSSSCCVFGAQCASCCC